MAALEKQADRTEEDVKVLTEKVDEKLERVDERLMELTESQAEQTSELQVIKYRVGEVQTSMIGMENKILTSVTGLLKVAKDTKDLDNALKEDSSLFSKEKMNSYRKVGAIIALIAGLLWGFLEGIGFGGLNSRKVDQAYIDHLQGKDKK